MDEIRLSREAITLLRELHKSYKKQRKSGKPKEEARVFGDSPEIHQDLVPEWSLEDVVDACYELNDADFLNCVLGNDDIQLVVITNAGIDFAENYLLNGFKKVWEAIREIFPLLPSLGG